MRKVSSVSLVFWIIIVLISPYIVTHIEFFEQFESTGTIGDTIGGIMNPLVTIIAVWLTYKAFLVQYEANENQKEVFQQQQLDLRIQRFENIFFEQVVYFFKNVAVYIFHCFNKISFIPVSCIKSLL